MGKLLYELKQDSSQAVYRSRLESELEQADRRAQKAEDEIVGYRADIARLKAQRDELLEALVWLVHLACGVSKDGNRDISSKEIADAVDAGKAAIEKARGNDG